MGLFFTLLGVTFIIGFVIVFFTTLQEEEKIGLSAATGAVMGVILSVIVAVVMAAIIATTYATADVYVEKQNAQAAVYRYQLEQIAGGDYLIEEQSIYQKVVAHNSKVAGIHAKVDSKFYNWFNPAIYKNINLVEIPEREEN